MTVFFLSRHGHIWLHAASREVAIAQLINGLGYGYAVELWDEDISFDRRAA
jgi:hypothetical protein